MRGLASDEDHFDTLWIAVLIAGALYALIFTVVIALLIKQNLLKEVLIGIGILLLVQLFRSTINFQIPNNPWLQFLIPDMLHQ